MSRVKLENLPDPVTGNPDQCARWVLMTAHLYYDRGESLISDEEFDALCRRVASAWGELHPTRQEQLGSPEDILATAHHVKLTVYSISAAESLWARAAGTPLSPYTFSCIGHLSCGARYTTIKG